MEESKIAKRSKAVSWTVTHVGLTLLTYFGIWRGHEWALNGLKFMTWLVYMPFVAFAIFAADELKKEIRKHPPFVAPWFTWLIDLGVAVCLAFNAMWFYAAMAGIAGSISFALKSGDGDGDEKPEDEPKQPRPLGDYFFEEDLSDGILGKSGTDGRKDEKDAGPYFRL